MKHSLSVLVLVALAGCAAAKPAEDVAVSDKVQAMSDAEGGCALFAKAAIEAHIEDAFTAGYQAGAAAEAKKRGAL